MRISRNEQRVHLHCEQLESRECPANLTVTGMADGVGTVMNLGGGNYSASTLRTAVNFAQSSAESDLITLMAGTYTVSSSFGVLTYSDLANKLTIRSTAGATINASGAIRHLNNAGNLELDGLRFTNGNVAGAGGSILNTGVLNVLRSQFVGNAAVGTSSGRLGTDAKGGAIYSGSGTTLTVTDSLFDGNTATGASNIDIAGRGIGGAICAEIGNAAGSTVLIQGTTFARNVARGGDSGGFFVNSSRGGDATGGALFLDSYGRVVRVQNTTFSSNSAIAGRVLVDPAGGRPSFGNGGNGTGGGLSFSGAVGSDVVNTTIVLNLATGGTSPNVNGVGAGGGLVSGTNNLRLTNTIIALNRVSTTGVDGFGTVSSQGGNLIGIGTGLSGTTANDQVGTTMMPLNPGIDPALANNGGPTPTHRLVAGSTAIDRGINTVVAAFGLKYDQRGSGFGRLRGYRVDVGAFESPAVIGMNVTYNVAANTPLVVPATTGLLQGLTPPMGVTVTMVVKTNPVNGTLSGVTPDGGFTYTPRAGYTGSDSFTFCILVDGVPQDTFTAFLSVSGIAGRRLGRA